MYCDCNHYTITSTNAIITEYGYWYKAILINPRSKLPLIKPSFSDFPGSIAYCLLTNLFFFARISKWAKEDSASETNGLQYNYGFFPKFYPILVYPVFSELKVVLFIWWWWVTMRATLCNSQWLQIFRSLDHTQNISIILGIPSWLVSLWT